MPMRWQCQPEPANCYVQTSMWNWAILHGCFGSTRISPTDVDGLVERNGHYLLLECKGAKVTGLDTAQHIVFRGLARDHGVTVFVLYGDRNLPTRMTVFHPGGDVERIDKTDLDGVRCRVKAWFAFADQMEKQPA